MTGLKKLHKLRDTESGIGKRCDSHQAGNLAPAKSAELEQWASRVVTVTLPTAGTLRSSFAFSHHNGERWIACSSAAAAGPELIGRLDKEFYWKTDESAVTSKLYAAISYSAWSFYQSPGTWSLK